MRLRRVSLAAFTTLLTVHCTTPAPESTQGPASSTPADTTTDDAAPALGGKNLIRYARVEGYGNPVTGEAWMKLAPVPKPQDGVGVSANALTYGTGAPGYCQVLDEAHTDSGNNSAIGSVTTPSFEWFTWGQVPVASLPSGYTTANSGSSNVGATCLSHVSSTVVNHPGNGTTAMTNLYANALCFRQRLGNYTGLDGLHVYFDIDEFSGDPNTQAPFGFNPMGYPVADNLASASNLTSVRNTPDTSLGLWDLGTLNDGDSADFWFMFRNDATTDYRWAGYLLLEVQEECEDLGDTTMAELDDDCDGVVNNGCGDFAVGASCFEDADCSSGTCANDNVVINSGYGAAGNDTNRNGTSLDDDVPGHCLGAVGDPCSTDADCMTNLACANSTLCVGVGALSFRLTYAPDTDYDLWVQLPGGGTVSYQGGAGGGVLDVDSHGSPAGQPHIENIDFASAPASGTYYYWVNNFSGTASGNYTLEVFVGGVLRQTYSGTLGVGTPGDDGAQSTHHPFAYPTACGDGAVTIDEACDDGDVIADDGCSATCTVESGYQCSGSPSVCLPLLVSSGPAVDSAVAIDVSAYLGCNIASYTQNVDMGGVPVSFYVMPCDTTVTCPFGTALSSSTDCGCAQPGYVHFALGQTSGAFPAGVVGAGLGYAITDPTLTLYIQDLTFSSVGGSLDLQLECPP